MSEARGERPPFSLTEGGPFHRLLVRARVRRPSGMARAWWIGLLLWIPIALVGVVPAAFGVPLDPMLLDLSLHIRVLFALPVMLLSEQLLERTSRSAVDSFFSGRFCERAPVDRIVDRVRRLRDAGLVEAVLVALALLSGQLVLWEVVGATGWFHGGGSVENWTFPRLWYALIALPLVQFVMVRFLWRWLIWCYVLWRLSRLPLATLATHADLAAGLAPLSRPVSGFSGFVLALAAILAGAWGTQVLEGRTSLDALLPGLAIFLLVATAVALAPMLAFTGQLFRTRRRGLAQYGDFVRDYTLRFHAKWIERPAADLQPLGAADIQSLNDLGQAYEVVSRTRLFIFGPRVVLTLWTAGMLPMIPLFASALPVEQVLKRILTTVLGGLPL